MQAIVNWKEVRGNNVRKEVERERKEVEKERKEVERERKEVTRVPQHMQINYVVCISMSSLHILNFHFHLIPKFDRFMSGKI